MKNHANSGGIQKDAYMPSVPGVTMRENTEWVDDGWNVLVGADYGVIADAIVGFEGAGKRNDVFGRRDASERILTIISKEW